MSLYTKSVIHPPRPWRLIIIGIITLLLVIFAVWLYIKPTQQIRVQLQETQLYGQELSDYNQQLKEDYLKLVEKFNAQQRVLALQQATDKQLQNQLDELQGKVIDLNKELLFYQRITQGTNSSDLQIRELDLRSNDTQVGTVDYRLVITQGKKIKKPITGIVTITLNSQNNDTSEQLIIGEYKLKLRHVQVIEGHIKLSDDLVPNSIAIVLTQKNKTILSQTFDWKIDSSTK